MRTTGKRYPVLLMTAVLAAAISGCGGGSSTKTDTDIGMTGGTDTGMTGGTDTGMTGGTDTGMTGGDQPLAVPDSMARSTTTPVYATSADTFDSAGPETRFPALSAVLVRDFGASTVTLEDAPLDSRADFSIADGGVAATGDGETVLTFVLEDGEEVSIPFTSDDFDETFDTWIKEVDGETFEFWYWDRSFRHFAVVATESPGDEGESFWANSTFGARTPLAAMPAGTATYFGRARADSWPDDAPSGGRPTRQRIRGDLRLTANFANSTLDGRVTGIEVRKGGESQWSDWPDTTYFSIGDGKIVDGQFTATLTGEDSNANAAMDESLDGYEGDVLGEFYGPAAEEVGGVFTATRDDDNRALVGWLGGGHFNPGRLAGSPRTPVSVGVNRDFNASTSQLTDAASVTAVESDGADGFYVTYMIDGAAERVHLPVSGYDRSENVYNKVGPPDYGIWQDARSYLASSEFDYLSVNGWYYWSYETEADGSRTTLDTSRGHMVYGDATANMPASTAQYAGRAYLNGWSRTNPGTGARERFEGSLALTADFDGGTIGGSLENWRVRGPGESGYSNVDAEIVVQNGTITNNQLSAELTGMRDAADFTGNMTGQFFGPDAAEVGGVIDGESTDSVFEGWFGGKKQ